MVQSRGAHRYERVTITLVPTADERSFRHIPSTFNPTDRIYAWRQFENLEYMIIPKRISSKEVKIDMFIDLQLKGKGTVAQAQKKIQNFVASKIRTDWIGLRLAGISRATAASPPEQMYRRGTIEEILGTHLEQ